MQEGVRLAEREPCHSANRCRQPGSTPVGASSHRALAEVADRVVSVLCRPWGQCGAGVKAQTGAEGESLVRQVLCGAYVTSRPLPPCLYRLSVLVRPSPGARPVKATIRVLSSETLGCEDGSVLVPRHLEPER